MASQNHRKSRLQKMRERIYRRDWRGKELSGVRSKYYAKEEEVSPDWGREEGLPQGSGTPKDTLSMLRKIFIGSLIFFLLALGVAAYFFFGEGNVVSSENVDITARGPVTVAGGDEFSLQINVTNNNPTPLEFTDLVVEYPEGTQDPRDISRELPRFRESLGVIEPGETVNTIVRSVLFGEEGSEKNVKIALEYRVEGSNAIFVKESDYRVSISSSPLSLSVDTLNEVNANQEMEITAEVASNAEQTIENVAVRIDYPFGFEPSEAEPEPSVGSNVWEIGTIEPNDTFIITVRGTMRAQDEEEKIFSVYVGTQDQQDARRIATVYSSAFNEVLVKRPFLGMQLALNGSESEEHVISGNTPVRGILTWTNNTPSRVVDARLRMTIEGAVLDERDIEAQNGFYDSTTNTITWDQTQEDRLADLAPGATGELRFSFETLPLFSDEAQEIRNPVLHITLDAQGQRVSEEGAVEDIRSVVERTARVATDFALSARAVHFAGPFANTGPMPPRAEQTTQYTIMWTATNSSNDIVEGEIVGRLPSYVSWLGTTDPANAALSYNPNTREVTWNIGDVSAGTGSEQSAESVAFQIAMTPSVSQVDSTPVLMDDIIITGQDTFTNTIIENTHRALNTQLSTDPQFSGVQGQVRE